MNETADMLAETMERLLVGQADAEATGMDQSLWTEIEALGLPLALAPEAQGGSGLSFSEARPILHELGRHAARVPLAETMVAALLLAQAGLASRPGPLAFGPVLRGETAVLERGETGLRLRGTLSRIPWARDAAAIVVIATLDGSPWLAVAPPALCTITPGANLAGEPRDTVAFDLAIPDGDAAPLDPAWARTVILQGAACRTAQIAGALDDMVTLCASYAQDRVQFGRPIGKFQAVQHLLAVLAGHAAMASAAADLAAEAIDIAVGGQGVAVAKAVASEAAGEGSAIAHQVHGAIGVTREYRLHRSTLRLLSWRDEFGGETLWQNQVGGMALATGGGGVLWEALTE